MREYSTSLGGILSAMASAAQPMGDPYQVPIFISFLSIKNFIRIISFHNFFSRRFTIKKRNRTKHFNFSRRYMHNFSIFNF